MITRHRREKNIASYDKIRQTFKTLKENKISQYNLYTYRGVSRAQIQRLKKNKSVTTHTLNKILNILGEGFTLDDIAEYIPDKKEDEE